MSVARVLSLGIALWLAAAGGAAGLALAREARATSFGSLSWSLDRRAAHALFDVELYRAISAATPEHAPIFFIGDAGDVGSHLAFSETEPLVFPRRFYRIDEIPETWTPAGIDPDVAVVAYGPLRELDLALWFEPVAEGARFRLWRLKPEAR